MNSKQQQRSLTLLLLFTSPPLLTLLINKSVYLVLQHGLGSFDKLTNRLTNRRRPTNQQTHMMSHREVMLQVSTQNNLYLEPEATFHQSSSRNMGHPVGQRINANMFAIVLWFVQHQRLL